MRSILLIPTLAMQVCILRSTLPGALVSQSLLCLSRSLARSLLECRHSVSDLVWLFFSMHFPAVIQLLSDLPRDAAGLASFHDAQKLIMRYREKQIARFKVIFPEVATGLAKKRFNRAEKSPQGVSGQGRAMALVGETEMAEEGATHGPPLASAKRVPAGRSSGGEATRGGGFSRRAKFSADVAPPEMFMKDVGFTPAGVAKHVRDNSLNLAVWMPRFRKNLYSVGLTVSNVSLSAGTYRTSGYREHSWVKPVSPNHTAYRPLITQVG